MNIRFKNYSVGLFLVGSIAFSFLQGSDDIDESDTNKEESSSPLPANQSLSFINQDDTLAFDKFDDILNYFTPKVDSVERLLTKLRKLHDAGNPIQLDSIDRMDAVYKSILNERNKTICKYVTTHKKDEKSLRGLFYVAMIPGTSIEFVDSVFRTFPSGLQKSSGGQILDKKIKEKMVRATQPTYNPGILNTKFTTADGSQISLSEIGTKYILLDFWSSWCGPCRYENRIMVKKKDLIASKGNMTIVAISLDTDSGKWLKACADDKLNYLSVCDFKELQSPIVKEFNITPIPENVLISKDGKILKRNVWGDELIEFVKTLP